MAAHDTFHFRSTSTQTFSEQPNTILSQLPRRATRKTPHDARSPTAPLGVRGPGAASRADQLANLADFLPPNERQLIRCLFSEGQTLIEVAALLNQPKESVRRRLHRLTRRMSAPEFAFVALRRDSWPPRLRAVACACVLEGKSLRVAAAELSMSVHAVRCMRDHILAMSAGVQEAAALERRWRKTAE